MAFAGLSESWLGADGSEVDTMAILTVAANAIGRVKVAFTTCFTTMRWLLQGGMSVQQTKRKRL